MDSNHHPGNPGQGPQPCTEGVDASSGVQIVQIVRFAGRIGIIGRYGRCQNVATDVILLRWGPKASFEQGLSYERVSRDLLAGGAPRLEFVCPRLPPVVAVGATRAEAQSASRRLLPLAFAKTYRESVAVNRPES